MCLNASRRKYTRVNRYFVNPSGERSAITTVADIECGGCVLSEARDCSEFDLNTVHIDVSVPCRAIVSAHQMIPGMSLGCAADASSRAIPPRQVSAGVSKTQLPAVRLFEEEIARSICGQIYRGDRNSEALGG